MSLNRCLGTLAVVALLVGCQQPQPKNGSTPAMTKSPAAVATSTPDAAPEATATPEATPDGDATPSETGTPTAAATSSGDAGKDAQLSDLEYADGMEGYDEVTEMAVVPSTPESIEKGKTLFAQNCATCHGADGKGGGEAGLALDPPPRNLTIASEYKYGHMDLAIYRTVHYGVEGTGMAPWIDTLAGPEEVWNLVHFVRSIQQ